MTDNTQPEALRLAAELDETPDFAVDPNMVDDLAAELRRQHARITEMEAQLEAIGAGGVNGPLMGGGAQPALSAGWVMVDERLPEVGVTVLVYEPFRHGEDWPDTVRIFFDYICPDYEGWHNHCASYEHFMAVGGANACGPDVTCTGPSEKAPYTHWMPLPPSPSMDGESNG